MISAYFFVSHDLRERGRGVWHDSCYHVIVVPTRSYRFYVSVAVCFLAGGVESIPT